MAFHVKSVSVSYGAMKGSPYTKFLNHEINKLRGSGILLNILSRYQKQPCQTDEALDQITLQKTVFLFAFFVVGVLLSIAILFTEKIIFPIMECNLKPLLYW